MDAQKRIENQLRGILIGAKVVAVEYLSQQEVDEAMWDKRPICIVLRTKDGKLVNLVPITDDEGNNGGAMYTSMADNPIIPTL